MHGGDVNCYIVGYFCYPAGRDLRYARQGTTKSRDCKYILKTGVFRERSDVRAAVYASKAFGQRSFLVPLMLG